MEEKTEEGRKRRYYIGRKRKIRRSIGGKGGGEGG